MSEDLYSLFFVSNLRHDYIYYHKNKDKLDDFNRDQHEHRLKLLDYEISKERNAIMVKTMSVFLFQITLASFLLDREVVQRIKSEE